MDTVDAFLSLFGKAIQPATPEPVIEREPWADHPFTCRCVFHR